MTIRIFTREQLDAWDLPGAWADDSPEILHREQVESRRWVSVNELIFRAPDDGKAYQVFYEEGLTEVQEDTDPWNFDKEIKGTEVEQRAKTTTTWEPVTDTSASTPASSVDLSEWATNLAADGLEPTGHTVQLGVDPGDGDRPRVRLHFAFHPDMPDEDRDHFVMSLSKVVLRNL